MDLLDRFGVRTLELQTDLPIDGLAARYGDEYVVILNSTVSNDRARLSAAHELGHVLYGDCAHPEMLPERCEEPRAMEFASHLLIPSAVLRCAFQGRSMVRLVQFKERYGISLAAMVYRAEKEGIISASLSRMLWIEFSRRGWRSREPGVVRPDRATRFEQLLDGATARGALSWREVIEVTGVRESELRKRLSLAMGSVVGEGPGGGGEDEDVRVLRLARGDLPPPVE